MSHFSLGPSCFCPLQRLKRELWSRGDATNPASSREPRWLKKAESKARALQYDVTFPPHDSCATSGGDIVESRGCIAGVSTSVEDSLSDCSDTGDKKTRKVDREL